MKRVTRPAFIRVFIFNNLIRDDGDVGRTSLDFYRLESAAIWPNSLVSIIALVIRTSRNTQINTKIMLS